MFGVGWVGTVGGEVVFDGGEGTVGCLASLRCCCCWSCGFWKLLKIRNIESINKEYNLKKTLLISSSKIRINETSSCEYENYSRNLGSNDYFSQNKSCKW